MDKEYLFGKTLRELDSIVSGHSLPAFNAKQMAEWIYSKRISTIDEMTNLSQKTRELLKEKFDIGLTAYSKVLNSKDGTKKYLFPVQHNKFIETAFIPEDYGNTICISSQVGCKMGCMFCMTGKQGFQGNLSANEIMNQYRSIDESEKVSNIVYMGMGEPFDNIEEVLKSLEIFTSKFGFAMSPKRITVSTIGMLIGLKQFLKMSRCHLAISLHSPFDEERMRIMPIQKTNPIREVINEIKKYDFSGQRRVSFEYIMFKGLNDTPGHVKELTKILHGISCRINLIRFHPIPGVALESSDERTIRLFENALNDNRILTTIRTSRGMDIQAACGMLSTKGCEGRTE
jgi:23S rRNA (adenine2503-C2)-methyltransferase